MAPADATVLPLDGAPLAPVDEIEAPLPAGGVVPAEPTEVAPADPPIVTPELAPVPTPVPLIGALHAPHAKSRTMLKAQPHAVPMRKVTFTLLVRSVDARFGGTSYATCRLALPLASTNGVKSTRFRAVTSTDDAKLRGARMS
jgi:hypothetical protein